MEPIDETMWKAVRGLDADRLAKTFARAGSGASVDARDWMGRTALAALCEGFPAGWALGPRSLAVAKALLAAGADPSAAAAPDGMSALMWACRAGQSGLAGLLINAGAMVEAVDRCGRSALHWSAIGSERECRSCAALLLAAGADPALRANDGRDALDCARLHGGAQAVEWALTVEPYAQACRERAAMRELAGSPASRPAQARL